MTTNYTLTPCRGEVLIEPSPSLDADALKRLHHLARYFGARQCSRPAGYIFTEYRAGRFAKLFDAGFCAAGKSLHHPAIPSRMFACQEAINILSLAQNLALTATVQ